MTRYWDRRAESLERVMRFISERNWSSVGVAIFLWCFGYGLFEGSVVKRVLCSRLLESKVACGFEVVCAPYHCNDKSGIDEQ